jgi:hypothetical protein
VLTPLRAITEILVTIPANEDEALRSRGLSAVLAMPLSTWRAMYVDPM